MLAEIYGGVTKEQVSQFFLAHGLDSQSLDQPIVIDDYGDGVDQASSINAGETLSGSIGNLSDSDWFSVSLEANVSYRFTLNSDELNTPNLTLNDSVGCYLRSESDSANDDGAQAELNYAPSTTGTYYLAVEDYRDDSTGSYVLSVEAGLQDDYFNTLDTQGTVLVGGTASGVTDYTGDCDWFAVELIANETYFFMMDSVEPSSCMASLFTTDGHRVAHASSLLIGGGYSEFSYVPYVSGTYYMEAWVTGGFSGQDGTGSYVVGVSAGTPGNYFGI
jgi:hypothetical protein